jgi:hypothetical protein
VANSSASISRESERRWEATAARRLAAHGRSVQLTINSSARRGPAPQKLDHLAVEELTQSAVLSERGGPA